LGAIRIRPSGGGGVSLRVRSQVLERVRLHRLMDAWGPDLGHFVIKHANCPFERSRYWSQKMLTHLLLFRFAMVRPLREPPDPFRARPRDFIPLAWLYRAGATS
jgi:hypothetical protein